MAMNGMATTTTTAMNGMATTTTAQP
jgi:hypothetical protein